MRLLCLLIGSHKVCDIWQKDKEKDLLCETLGIKLIRIKEYDWDNFKTDIKEKIKKLIIGEQNDKITKTI